MSVAVPGDCQELTRTYVIEAAGKRTGGREFANVYGLILFGVCIYKNYGT